MTSNRIDYLEKEIAKLKAKLANRDMWLDKLSTSNKELRKEIKRLRERLAKAEVLNYEK